MYSDVSCLCKKNLFLSGCHTLGSFHCVEGMSTLEHLCSQRWADGVESLRLVYHRVSHKWKEVVAEDYQIVR